ncbi:hypothetical protein FPV67DRAFT_1682210 [Lyophyllum atratum]|nr:hypothetical protein FPV67DRAFT_1682210 [Lyophyllum atratum]
MGFIAGPFYRRQRSNERPNIHFALEHLTHTIGGDTFPDLLPYLSAGRKTVIYCDTIELCRRVAVYLWSLLPAGLEKLTRVRLYHAMCWSEENEETIRLIRDEPRCQVIIATIAFAQGFNIKPLLDSIQLGVPSSMNQLVQQEGRIGRDGVSLSRGVVLAQSKAIESAERYMRAHFPSEMPPPLLDENVSKPKSRPTKSKTSKISQMDHSKARLLVERDCLIVRRNIIYQNPPLERTSLDCIEANRTVPCSLCLPRSHITLNFPPSPLDPSLPVLAPFCVPISAPAPTTTCPSERPGKGEFSLTVKMREEALEHFDAFHDTLRRLEKGSDLTGRTPRAAHFPTPLATLIVTKLMSIKTTDDIQLLIPSWVHLPRHGASLLDAVSRLQAKFRARRAHEQLVRNEKNHCGHKRSGQ